MSETLRRHARHLVLPEIGEQGQKKLAQAPILVVGVGGLGSAAAGYLAAMGVGRLGLIDSDRVELSNLQRQLLFEMADIGQPKVDAAQARIEEINPECKVEVFAEKLTAENASARMKGYDLVVDGCDNFATRFAVQDACHRAKKPLVSAAISGFEGQISTFKAYLGAPHPCYRCLVPRAPEREVSCAQEGIIGALAGVMGSLQALEAVKEWLGIGESLSGSLVRFDALAHRWQKTALPRDPACPLCA